VARSAVPSRSISLQFLPFNTACTCCVLAMFPICILVFQEGCLDCVHASDLRGALCYPWILRSEHVSVHLPCVWNMINTGCFKKSFTSLKAYRNLYRGRTQRFELSKCSKKHGVLTRIVIRNCFDLFFRFLLPHYQWKSH
jgi:hypothetical protein